MKKFIKTKLFILSAFLLVAGCGKDQIEVEDNGYFYDVVYQATDTRENVNKAWIPVNGIMQIKFTQNTAGQGTYAFYYANYKEPQFVYNSCSGGYKGNFELAPDPTEEEQDPNYNVLNPYVPEGNSGGEVTEEPVSDPNDPDAVAKIQTYKFRLVITARNLDAGCRPEADKNVVLYRFTSGEIIVKSEYREIKMRPKLVSEGGLD